MDSPVATQIFRRLFTTPARRCLNARPTAQPPRLRTAIAQRRGLAIRHKEDDGSGRSNWQQRLDYFPKDVSKELKDYPRVTANELRHRKQRPRRVKMYTRDFIEDSLYNPHYGYFSKHATIFSPARPFDFNAMQDEAEFNRKVDESYKEFEDALDEIDYDENRQLWHTPTELFQPHYGEAIARYLVTNYKMTLYPYHDLIIYEMGAGNGTLMRNILDYIRDTDPSVYARTKFRVIEISSNLHSLQKTALSTPNSDPDHLEHVELIHTSIFDWTHPVSQPCFFLALEVIDNFGHDSLRYDPYSEQPLQGSVLIDDLGEFYEYYSPTLDPLVTRYLRLRSTVARSPYRTPLTFPPRPIRKFLHSLPFSPNLTQPEYLPTRLMEFFDILATYFPHHRLILSDFTQLPDAVPGINAPVVQTRYQRRTIAVTTPFVHQGYFDIFFPTNFELMEDMYRAQTGKLTRVRPQREWLRGWCEVHPSSSSADGEEGAGEGKTKTTTKSGEDVMGVWYGNQGVMTTV